jgi:Glycosyl transferase family 8
MVSLAKKPFSIKVRQRLPLLVKLALFLVVSVVVLGLMTSTVLVRDYGMLYRGSTEDNGLSVGGMIAKSNTVASKPKSGGVHHCLNEDFKPKENISVWTMLNDNKDYVKGAIKIGRSIGAKTKTPVDLVVMELQHKPLTAEEWVDLRAVGWQRCTVVSIPAPQRTRPDLKEKFAVLHVWAMTVYDTVVFLDADTYPQNSIDSLIHMDLQGKTIGVTKDIRDGHWVETFNSGVLLLHPSVPEFDRLIDLLGSGMVFDYIMSDQGFLNEVYKGNWHEIGFVNNANLALYRFNRQFWDSHKPEEINIFHYTMSKPWKCSSSGTYGPICQVWHSAE